MSQLGCLPIILYHYHLRHLRCTRIVVPFVSLLMTNPLCNSRELLGLEMASPIILWKLNTPCYPTLDTSAERKDFADQVKNMQLNPDSDDPPGVVQLRYATRQVSSYWKKNPPPECLHLIVQVLSLPSRLPDGVLKNLRELHRLSWGIGLASFRH